MAFENSAVHDMILEYLERLPQDHTPVKAGILERSVMRAIAPKKLFPNPDDEFPDPKSRLDRQIDRRGKEDPAAD